MLRRMFFVCLLGIAATFAFLFAWPGVLAQAGFDYAKVTAEDMLALQFNHYFSVDRKGHEADFEWSFTQKGFAMKEAKGPIADYLTKTLALDAEKVKRVEGKWKLVTKSNGGQAIVFTDIKADGKPVANEVEMSIYRTAPTVIRIGEPQHVFARMPLQPAPSVVHPIYLTANFCTRWFCASTTYRLPWLSSANPCGVWNWPG